MTGVAGLQFNPFADGEYGKRERWRTWIRNFHYYIEGQIDLNDKQKIARLQHQAGIEVQDIYETIKIKLWKPAQNMKSVRSV